MSEQMDALIAPLGNLVHDSVPISDNEDNNRIERMVGEPRQEDKLYNHVDLVQLLDIVSLDEGQEVAGGRGYFLKGEGVLLNQALINCAMQFLYKKGYTPMHTPFFMRKSMMAKCAQVRERKTVNGGCRMNFSIRSSCWHLFLLAADHV
jgi:seryl-tRNA synthetase